MTLSPWRATFPLRTRQSLSTLRPHRTRRYRAVGNDGLTGISAGLKAHSTVGRHVRQPKREAALAICGSLILLIERHEGVGGSRSSTDPQLASRDLCLCDGNLRPSGDCHPKQADYGSAGDQYTL